MTCKDCDRQIVCRYYTQWANVEQIETDRCQYFKNKTDFSKVKNARWIYQIKYYSCSFCAGKRYNLLLGTDAEYCPYCGAKMIFEGGADNG